LFILSFVFALCRLDFWSSAAFILISVYLEIKFFSSHNLSNSRLPFQIKNFKIRVCLRDWSNYYLGANVKISSRHEVKSMKEEVHVNNAWTFSSDIKQGTKHLLLQISTHQRYLRKEQLFLPFSLASWVSFKWMGYQPSAQPINDNLKDYNMKISTEKTKMMAILGRDIIRKK
jgi:hypothetical protein